MRMFDIEMPHTGDAVRDWHHLRRLLLLGAGAAALGLLLAWHLLFPPATFPTDQVIIIPENATVSSIAEGLEAIGVIRSSIAFKAYTRLTGKDRSLASGLYIFARPHSVIGIANRIARGEHGITPMRVTLTEGMSVREMGQRLDAQIPGFDKEAFLVHASTSEGYLFPDTYDFMPNASSSEVVSRMRARFDEQARATPELASSSKPLADLVIMASLLEREAQTSEDMRIIAGILWDRIEAGMPLQVDAVFGYIYGRSGYAPTLADLEIDSPYNTYLYKGLPPGPIGNPGLTSLIAAATPTESEYVYYLTGRDGKMYYAETFDEHRENRRLYLD